jgi:glutamate-1-semialdehyde 2,1-aminomutase
VPAAAANVTVIVPWNDQEAVIEATERHELAAILAEPVPANMGVVPPADGFLELLRDRADQTGALLVFDEVITGFRVARGGAQERFGVIPDLTIMGKVVGGGLPQAAFGGPHVLMELIAPAGDVYQAGTLSGNPLAVAAALATLELLDDRAYRRLESITQELADGLRGVGVTVQSVPGLVTPFFSASPIYDYSGAMACDLDANGAWCRALLTRGVYPPPSQFEAWFPSLAHTHADIEQTVRAAREAFAEALA